MELDGCDTEDKDECSTSLKGPNDAFTCFCKSDYCNGAGSTRVSTGIIAAVASWFMARAAL